MSATWCCRAWRFGYVLRSPHAHARIRSIDTAAAKAAPGVLAVLTGADWQASGWGDLPVPGGLKRRDGSVFKPPYPALAKDRVRWVGDYVAFVVAETYIQAMDAAELIEVDYEPLPAIGLDRGSERAGRAAGVGRLRRQYRLRAAVRRQGRDRRRLRQGRPRRQASLRDQPRHRRQHGAARLHRRLQRRATDRYTIYTTLQRVHPFRSELSPMLKVPESKIRVVAGDIGGSFGMKSAVYNEVALVLLASKLVGRPVKWMSTRSEVVPVRRPGPRQRHRGRARARQGRQLPRHARERRSPASAPTCRPACRPSPAISARWPASIASPPCMST